MVYQNCPFQVVPYAQPNMVKNKNLININYTNQDFWSMKARLIDYIKEQFGSNFNDFVESDLAIMLIENWAFIADTLSFKIDQIANEVFIDTVAELDNIFRLAMLVGFKPTPPIPLTAMFSSSISAILETDLIINTPMLIDFNLNGAKQSIELFPADSSGDPMFGEPIIISAGSTMNTSVIGLGGRTINQIATGNGQVGQYVTLNYGPVFWQSVNVEVDGITWTEVDYFTDSQPRTEFRVEYDTNYNAYVMFGNNVAGMMPSSASQISITYRVSTQSLTNLVTGSVQYQRNYAVPGFEYMVPVSFSNYTQGQNFYPGDTLDDVKSKLPPYLRTQNRAVTGDDYKTLAETFQTAYHGQINKANAVLRNYGCAANVIDIYVLASDGDESVQVASNELKVLLQDYMNTSKMITDLICLKDGVIIEVDVHVDIVCDKFYKKTEDEIVTLVNSRIDSFFSLNNWDFGIDLKSTNLLKQLSDIKEINDTEVTFLTNELTTTDVVTANFYEIIRPGSIEINPVYE